MKTFITGVMVCAVQLIFAQPVTQQTLRDFQLQSSAVVAEDGDRLSDPSYTPPIYWFPVKVPSTVLTGLVANGVYPDPYQGMNNMYIPDASDEFNKQYDLERYSHLPNDPNPWKKPYWYRTRFFLPSGEGKFHHLVLKGINYRAEVWLNGRRVADSTQLAGMFAEHELNVTNYVRTGAWNGLAVKIYPLDYPGLPSKEQLKIFDDFYPNGGPTGDIGKNVTMLCSVGWDWMPPVRDRNMGIWQPVFIRSTGALKINYPTITTKLNLPDTTSAELTLQLSVENLSGVPRQATLRVMLEPQNFQGRSVSFTYPVNITSKRFTKVSLTAQQVSELKLANPALWWPLHYGKPNVYRVTVDLSTNAGASDRKEFLTGIRTVSSSATKTANSVRRDFFVNGRRIHLVGGAWVPDMMLQNDSLRIARELQHVKNANMNLVRIWGGGVTPSDIFFDLCDRLGLLVWSDFWVTGDTQGEFKGSPDWPLEGHVFVNNVTSTIYRVRHHASLLVWTGGNEGHARRELYDAMRDSVAIVDGTRPFIPSSSGFAHLPEGWPGSWPDNQPSGVYSGGPYTWQDPKVYYDLTQKATDWVFKDETGIPSQPPYTTLPKIIPNLVWDTKAPFPFNDTWGYHDAATGNGRYDKYYEEMIKRYGAPKTMEEFSDKMQLMNAMGYQGIFEAPQSKLKETGGVMLWKLNPAFPSVIWQLYDWYLLPNAGYHFTKQSTAPVHAQFNRLTNRIDVVNRTYQSKTVTVTLDVIDLNGKVLHASRETVTLKPESVGTLKTKTLQQWSKVSGIQFVLLRVQQPDGTVISRNTYWLEPNNDFTALQSMKNASFSIAVAGSRSETGDRMMTITVTNTSDQLAFFTRLQLLDAQDEEILPSYWSDNYITLKPGEQQVVTVWLDDASPQPVQVRAQGWNTPK